MSVWILTSFTYKKENPVDEIVRSSADAVVGVFETQEAAEDYRRNANPPVLGPISEWSVSAMDDKGHGEFVADVPTCNEGTEGCYVHHTLSGDSGHVFQRPPEV